MTHCLCCNNRIMTNSTLPIPTNGSTDTNVFMLCYNICEILLLCDIVHNVAPSTVTTGPEVQAS